MKIILPVAGKGERMRPYTNNLPKCLLPVGGKTIIDWIVGDTRPLAPTPRPSSSPATRPKPWTAT